MTYTSKDLEGKSASELLSMKAGNAPDMSMTEGTFVAQIMNWAQGESKNKKTPFVSPVVKITRAGSDVDQTKLADGVIGKEIKSSFGPLVFYLTGGAMGMLDDFLVNKCAAISEGQQDEDYTAVFERLVGSEIGLVYGVETLEARNGKPARDIITIVDVVPVSEVP